MQLMRDAGFISVFLGIETPDESGLIAANKLQNTRRSLLDCVATIQSYGMQVMEDSSSDSIPIARTSLTAWWNSFKRAVSR